MTITNRFRINYVLLIINSLLISLISVQFISGQDSISAKKDFKNTIRFNLTNPMIFGDQCLIGGYERTIGNHQSFSVGVGRFTLPRLFNINTDSIKDLTKDIKTKGFHASGDYRFYLSKENKFDSPHGVYIGPYVTYNSYTRYFNLKANTHAFVGELDADLTFRAATIGFQLGYQFIFWNRVSLDMILFGPGIGAYKIKTSLSTNLDPDTESELFKKINEVLQEKIPGYSQVISPGSFERTGSFNTTGMGFRYVVMLGFRF